MLKKGKFKLFSYIIDKNLLFYTSINRNRKFLAFSLIETKEFHPLISNLNKFLCKRYLNYYSIQIDVNDQERKIIILNFEDNDKERVIKLFNIVRQKLTKYNKKLHFLKDNILERTFKSILIKEINSNSHILKDHDSVMIKEENTSIFYDFYFINLGNFEKKITFIHNFLKLIRNFNQSGYLVFNIKVNYKNNLVVSPFFISKRKNNKIKHELESELNSFYNYTLIEKHQIERQKIYLVLWRFKLFNKSYLFNDVHELFLSENEYNFNNLKVFNRQFESNLLKKKLKFKRLNQNLLFVEQEILIFTITNLDYKLFFRILKKYYSKYFIYLLLLNKRDYEELIAMDYINLLENIKIMNSRAFSRLNLKDLKTQSLLKNTQVDGNILSRIIRM